MAEVVPGVRKLSNGVSNWYVVGEGGKLTLVDAGKPSDWKALLRELEVMGLPLDSVDCVLLTHAHSDHTGFAERARTEAGATVRVHPADAEAARSGKSGKAESGVARYLVHPEAYRTLFGLMAGGGLRIVPVAQVSTFAEGEAIDVPGHPRAVHVPGHTPGSCALWFEATSVLCTGDALVTRNPMTGRRGPQIMPSGLNVSSQDALDSLTALEETRATLVLPGHGEPWRQGAEAAVRAARAAGMS
ncbi:MAG: MBL fold metallo-hydrolase [Candidatus Dormibacteraeota bacterium]|nr:MBL fold metallo-hydrolase [Candidatus Dormibacteraeota bacterium]MBV9524970.1 MBL fold metallo-hydrolase [Candidatus Dormibacteraeota bacterium]